MMKRIIALLLCLAIGVVGLCLPASAEDYTVEQVIAMIDALPATDALTVADEPAVNAAYEAYMTLSISNRKLVTNYETMREDRTKINDLKKAAAQAEVDAINNAIIALQPVGAQSAPAILAANELVLQYVYVNGMESLAKITAYNELLQARDQYNALFGFTVGDVNGDDKINASDALTVLRFSVGKGKPTKEQESCADVNGDGKINAADALLILKFSVKKIDSFPASAAGDPLQLEEFMTTEKTEALFANTYQSMLDRTHSNGYAQTSVTGAYDGMYCRDTSIQIAMHTMAGDYEQARLIMTYLLDYHKRYGYKYVIHVMRENNTPISDKVQTDTTFFFLHAWYLYVTKAPASAAKDAFIAKYTPQIKEFADYYIEHEYQADDGLFLNPSLEHSRDNSYWRAYDLLTNTYASQALHEMALYFKSSDPTHAKTWQDSADKVVKGVHNKLTSTKDGKKFYCEMIDAITDEMFYGFSWVNLAPMGCDWYGADPEILENTYQLYLQYGSVKYYGKFQMLEVVTTLGTRPSGNHVIGKGLAWEMMYCKKTGKNDRLRLLEQFVEQYSDQMYRETWLYRGGGSDTANQEHASWVLLAHTVCFPKLLDVKPSK